MVILYGELSFSLGHCHAGVRIFWHPIHGRIATIMHALLLIYIHGCFVSQIWLCPAENSCLSEMILSRRKDLSLRNGFVLQKSLDSQKWFCPAERSCLPEKVLSCRKVLSPRNVFCLAEESCFSEMICHLENPPLRKVLSLRNYFVSQKSLVFQKCSYLSRAVIMWTAIEIDILRALNDVRANCL